METNIDNSKKVTLNSNFLTSSFEKYKEYILPIVVVLVCFIILFLIILPQFQNYLVSRQQLDAEARKLSTLKNNYNFLTNLDDTENDADFKTLSLALPSNKDFTGIISGISAASSKTGVGIGNFSFSLGDLSKSTDQAVNSNPSIKIEISLVGNTLSVIKFINELYKTVPLSEVTSIKSSSTDSNLIILFYYKPFPPQNISDEAPVIPLSEKNQKLLKDIYAWNNASGENVFTLSPSSSSSASSSSPTGSNPSPF